MILRLSELAANERSKRYATARRWAARRTRQELEHAVAKLFEQRMAGLGQYGSGGLSRRREAKAVHDRTTGYVLKTKMQAKRGGKAAAKERQTAAAAEWQDRCIRTARRLMKEGDVPSHKLASTLSTQFGKSERQVREILQRAGVLEKRK